VKYAYGDQAIFALVTAGVSLIIAAILALKVNDVDDENELELELDE